jgi:predicted ATP-dependent serine protease
MEGLGEVQLSEQWMCPNCGVVSLNTAGKCERCNSDQVVPLMSSGEVEITKSREEN